MDIFWKASASILISVILILILGKQERDIAALLAIAVCCMVGICLVHALEPIMDFLYSLQSLAGSGSSVLKSLLKITGISLVCEIVSAICADAGCASLGKSLQLLGCTLVLCLSVPILETFAALVQEILGGI